MALISAKDYLAKRDSPPISGGDGSDSSNNSPSLQLSSPPKGLMSASDFLKNKQMNHTSPEMSQDDIMTSQHQVENAVGFSPKPFSNDPIVPSVHSLLNPDASQFMQSVNQINADNPQSFADQVQKPNFLETIFKNNPIARVLNYPFAKAAQLSVPDANYLGTDINARQDFAQRNPIPSTGSPILDKVGDFAGGIGSMFTPIGTGGALVNDVSKISSGLLGTKAGQWLDNAAGKLGANTANLANPLLNQAGINLSTDLAQKAGQGLLRGGTLGAAFGAVQPLATGSGQLSDVPQSMLQNAAMFAGADAALPFVGAGVKALGQKFAGTKIGDALNNFFNRNHPDATPDVSTQSDTMPTIPNSPIRLKPLNSEDSFNSILPKVYQQATEQMTPPLENQNELAKWVQGHLNQDGHDVSLNDVRKLNYNDLSDMATELQKGFNTYNVVRQTAHDMGYGKIFDQTAPTLKDQIATDAQKRMYGIYPDNVNIGKSDSLNMSRKPIEPISNPLDNSFKVGDSAIPTTADGAHLSEPKIIEDIQSKDGVKYYKFEGSNTYMPENMVSKADGSQGKALNADAKLPQPIKLTDKQAAKNARADNFARIEDNPTLPNTASQIQSKTIKEKTSLGQKIDQAYINTVDNVYGLNKFDKASQQANGGTLKPSDSAYKLALNSRNADMQARQILEHNMIDSQGNVTGDSLKSIAEQIPAKDMKAFEDYQVAKHSITRMGRGEKVYSDDKNMTIQKAQMIVDNYDKTNPEFKTVNDQYQKFDGQLAQNWLVDTGMIKQSQLDGVREANPNYTPNNRIFSDIEKNNKFGSKGGFADQSKPLNQEADGSPRPIVSPLESRIEHVATYVKTAKQNEVGQAIVRNLQANPEALKGFAEIVHDEPHVNVDEILKKDGPDGLMNHISQSLENAKQKPDLTKGNVVSVLMNGEVVHVRTFDPQFLEAVGNLSQQAQPKWIEAVGKVTKFMKTTTTGVNPIFALTKNIWKDIPHSYIASKTTNPFNPMDTLRFGSDLVSALADVVGNREAYQAYKNMGGGHSSSLSADRNLLAQSVEKIVPSTGIIDTLKRNLLTKPYHALENFNNAIETAPRLAEAKRIMKQGDGSYNSKVEAIYQANDLTTNFNKHGNYTKQLDSLWPYLNASVQGLDQIGRMFKSNPVTASVKAAMAISVPTAILYAVNHNDPNYQNMSNYMKDNNFLIPKGDGTFFRIPKPRELGMVFGSSIERVMRQHFDNDPKAFQDFASNLIQNFAPPLVGGAIQGIKDNGITGAPLGALRDSIAAPMINLGLNKDFANRPIVPKDLASLSPNLQVDPRTSEPAKFLGNLTGSSPKKLDYLAKSYLGGISSLGIPLSTTGNGGNFISKLGNTLNQMITADPLYSNDIQSNFYNEKAKQDQAKADFKATGTQQQQDFSAYYDRVTSNIAPLRKQEKMIQKDNSLSDSEKQAKLRDIQATLNDLLKRGLLK